MIFIYGDKIVILLWKYFQRFLEFFEIVFYFSQEAKLK